MVEHEIEPGEVLPVLTGRHVMDLDAATLVCQGVTVCTVEDSKVNLIACDHFCHGVHPNYKDPFTKLRELMAQMEDVFLVTKPERCPKCGGSGWLDPGTNDASSVVLLAAVFGMFRGIPLPADSRIDSQGRLNLGEVNAIITEFLSRGANLSTDASPNPASDHAGRVHLSGEETEQEKTDGD